MAAAYAPCDAEIRCGNKIQRGAELFVANTLSRGLLMTQEGASLVAFEQVSSVGELVGVSDELIQQISEHIFIQKDLPLVQSEVMSAIKPYFHI